MKKLIALILALCLVLCVLSGCGKKADETGDAAAAETAAAETAETAAADGAAAAETAEGAESAAAPDAAAVTETAGVGQGGTGYESFPADMVVATVNGEEVTWMEYYYWLRYYSMYVQQLAEQYGITLASWDANDLSGDNTNAEVVIMNAQANLIQDHAVRTGTAALGVTITPEDQAELDAIFDQNADAVTGNGDGEVTDEERLAFEGYLAAELFVDKAFFNQFNAVSLLGQRGFETEYGANGANLPDADTMAFAEDNDLLAAKHILFLTVDNATREALTDEEIAAKRALAEEVYARLEAVKDDPEKLAPLFDELMAEYTEDTGYAAYPDGYVFGAGEMVQAFEDAVRGLSVGELSGIVESEYGYHIILRIPVDPDASVGTDANGNDVSLRYAAATQQYNAEVAAWTESADVVWSEGFETPDLNAIFG